ncbi:MAG: hypothetical protein LBD14_05575 [Puniceicoccales bacterium]|jgi:hypothetical protein|nr:hypothetical protein [Puniceicoccales bacterium]
MKKTILIGGVALAIGAATAANEIRRTNVVSTLKHIRAGGPCYQRYSYDREKNPDPCAEIVYPTTNGYNPKRCQYAEIGQDVGKHRYEFPMAQKPPEVLSQNNHVGNRYIINEGWTPCLAGKDYRCDYDPLKTPTVFWKNTGDPVHRSPNKRFRSEIGIGGACGEDNK